MYDELVKRLRETSCGAEDTLWWQAADAIEELQGKNKTIYIVVARGKGALRMMECRRCGKRGWFGADTPKYCIECGAKVNLLEDKT